MRYKRTRDYLTELGGFAEPGAYARPHQSKQTRFEKKLALALTRAGIQYKDQVHVNLTAELRKKDCVPSYVLDFLVEKKLDVEVDGPIHKELEVKRRDMGRDSSLKKMGYRVMRIPNKSVAADVGQVVDIVRRDLDLYRVE